MTASPPRRRAARRYLIEFGSAMAAYVVVLLLSTAVVRSHPDAGWRFAVAVAPVVPAVGAAWAVLRHVRHLDERERLVQLQAVTLSAVVVGLATFTYGFLELAGAPALAMVWVLPALIVVWGLGVAVAGLRDR
jgi:uncharacterized membrane protein YcfT